MPAEPLAPAGARVPLLRQIEERAMNQLLPRLSWLVTVRPWLTLAVLVIITVVLAAGAGRRAQVVEGAALAFLPPRERRRRCHK